MPTRDPRSALTSADVVEVVADALDPSRAAGTAVGLEVEFLPVVPGPPSRRLPLDGPATATTVRGVLAAGGVPSNGTLPGGGRVTLEPGGQVEVSTSCHLTVDDALVEADAAAARLAAWFDRAGVALVAAGIDAWHSIDTVPQQLRQPRYPAMDAYFAARGPSGATMMRQTCALQLSLDLGTTATDVHERWEVANLLAPVATATFANSPSPDGTVRSLRSIVWQTLDETRTGFAPGFLDGRGTLVEQVADAALAADVLLVASGPDGPSGHPTHAAAGTPGWTFGDWLAHGHAQHGWPTGSDLRHHLTTLFHEVRPRGPIEIRSIDVLPHRWRAVPVVLYAGALYDAAARSRVHEVLAPYRHELPALLHRAAVTGVADPALCALAVEAWSFALAGARRLPGVGAGHLRTAEEFLDRFTLRGRCPADDLAAALRRGPDVALATASEPVPLAHASRT